MARYHQDGLRQKRSVNKSSTSYRHGLKEAIGDWFPGQFFSRWSVTRGAKWSPQRIFWVAVLMVWNAEHSLQARFLTTRQALRSLFPKWPLGRSYTGWYEAQLRWITPLRQAVTKRFQEQLTILAGKHWQREGWCAFTADGSRVECPRTADNEESLGCAGRKKTGPQLYVTTLWHMGTGLPWDFRIGPGTSSERHQLRDMLSGLPRQSLLVADAGFTGYDLYRSILAAGQNFLLRVGSNVRLLRRLGYLEREGRDIVYLWPHKCQRKPPVVLRLIKCRRGKKKMHLVTNLLDAKTLSDKSVAVLYEMRWGVEVFYRSLKQTLQRRKMLSRTPEAAKCELTWAMLGMWLLGWLSVTKMLARDVDPLLWSAALARNRVRHSMRLALLGKHRDHALNRDLGRMVKDGYRRYGRKEARHWPHKKKKEAPPGDPKIQLATKEQRLWIQQLKLKNPAA